MKIYRMVTLVAAVLITVLLVGFIGHEKVGDPQDQPPVETAGAP
ncbi:MAG: hypothetical protein JWN85_5144 [Gammaproteobacteria bacterium]|nr:hypothetical protein [Gammaproteobacteria bacterium]